ncbi:MAG TPA: DnaJ domain-containing protein [Kofleriaceae bacterium]|nr:DnaJ domain-containing protein [Kofleriaceae bacterium]
MEVAQGRVTDRPFARTVYTIAAQRFTGDLVLREGERRYKTSWEDGRVVAAESAAPADSPGRVALSAGLVTSTEVSAAIDAMARTPGSDPLHVLSELTRLKPDQVATLKRRLLAQRAARAFALPDAAYVLDNARSLRADPDVPALDARWLVYFGVRTHYTIDRLEREMTGLLDRGFRLADDALAALPAFGFGEGERVVMDRLSQHAWTPRQLLGACSGVDGRLVLSVMYALVACDCLEAGAVPSPAVMARGTETQPPRPQDATVAEAGGSRRRAPVSTSSAAPAVPGAAEHARLAHGTVRRLLFPGQGTSPYPTPDASARARRASTRQAPESDPPGEGTSGVPGATIPPGGAVSSRTTIPPASPVPARSTIPPGSAHLRSTIPPGSTTPSRSTIPPGSAHSRSTVPPGSTIPPGSTTPSGAESFDFEPPPDAEPGSNLARSRRSPSSEPPIGSNLPASRRSLGSEPPNGSTIPPGSITSPGSRRSPGSEPPPRSTTPPPPSRTRTTNQMPVRGRATTPPPARPHSTTVPPILRRAHNTTMPPSGSRAAATEIRRMIAEKIAAMDRSADHYYILGVSQGAKSDEIRAAYFGIAKRIHPDRLRAVGVTDVDHEAQRLFARINQAFGVLSDPRRRSEYSVMISAGGEVAVRKAQADAEERAGRVLQAEETFRRGEMALRRSMFEQARALFEEAVTMNNEEAEYHALLAWATWLAAPNKTSVADDVQRRLTQALALHSQCVQAHFYSGQVAKHSGQTQVAIDAFRTVIDLEPGHAEANLELRVLRGRLRKK